MPLLAAIALLSAAAIAYELLLTRLFAITLWHHFAYMVISLALLGYGASGTLLVFARHLLLKRFSLSFAAFATAFGVTAVGSTALAWRGRSIPSRSSGTGISSSISRRYT